MAGVDDIVITGVGCVTPLGIGRTELAKGLLEGKCAVRKLIELSDPQRTTYGGASIDGFAGKQFVTPRKALKVMSREVQIAYTAAQLAWQDARLDQCESLDVDRMGVVYGSEMIPGDELDLESAVRACVDDGNMDYSKWGLESLKQVYPLWMLKNLPNMPACHVGIAVDARGPNNTIVQEEVSSLLALQEAASIIDRGQADVMIVGGMGSRITPTRMAYRVRGLYCEHPAAKFSDEQAISQPFGTHRLGIIAAEAAAAVIIERRSHAIARQADILGRVCSISSRWAPTRSKYSGSEQAIAAAGAQAMERAGLPAEAMDHISAQGFSSVELDISEGRAIGEIAPTTPVTASSSYFGTAAGAASLLELIASLLGMQAGYRLPTLGTQQVDEQCPVQLSRERTQARTPHFLKLAFTPFGQAVAAVIECET